MAEIRPFHALRFDSSKVKLADVLTQPYDKITPAMQAAYYQRNPYNLVRFELGKPEPGDGAAANVYTRAAAFLADAQRAGVLRRDESPCFYVYVQKFANPLAGGAMTERAGLIVLSRIYDYDEGVVYRHEQTLAKPKADRVALLETTRAHSGQLFMLYDDPARGLDQLMETVIASRPADEQVADEYGTENLLWRISDPAWIARAQAAMDGKRLLIADGHHRYETAREYRDSCRKTSSDRNAAHEFVMMTLVNLHAPGVVVLPTHRLVRDLAGFDAAALRRGLEEFCEVSDRTWGPAVQAEVAALGRERTALAVISSAGCWIAQARREEVERRLGKFNPLERRLDVIVLHELVLAGVLKISAEAVREQRNVRYFRSADEAVAEVGAGANAAFLLNPISLPAMRDVCYAGGLMPQKSTDFYPKLLSGLALAQLDVCFSQVAHSGPK